MASISGESITLLTLPPHSMWSVRSYFSPAELVLCSKSVIRSASASIRMVGAGAREGGLLLLVESSFQAPENGLSAADNVFGAQIRAPRISERTNLRL